jgi:hypothetical protein
MTVEEIEQTIEAIGALQDELLAILPDDPESELELKASELVGRVSQLMSQLATLGDDAEPDEDMEGDDAEPVDVEDV